MSDRDKRRLDELLKEAASIIKRKNDGDIPKLLGDGILDEFFWSLAPRKTDKEQTIYDYLLHNKNRLALIASLRYAITANYSIQGKVNDRTCFVSPHYLQWYDDGVMFVQGKERFSGLIGLYQDGKVKFGVMARDIKAGESNIGQGDLLFLDVEEAKKLDRAKAIPKDLHELDLALQALQGLLDNQENDEGKYQEYLERHPWLLGAQYVRIQSHRNLDDEHIPDFTGVRTRDKARDVIEIKQPFLPLFRKDGSFRAEFHRAWQQTEDYLDFVMSEAEYLYRRKGLRFDNPHCYLLIGYNLSPEQVEHLRRKEKMNARVTILTYNDLLAMGRSTAQFIKTVTGCDEGS